LESEGASVTIASDGAEAVKILTEGNQMALFDVVLMDLQMPRMDGLTATRMLRAYPNLQQLPIIAMTAHVMADEVQRCLEAGMNDHVGKPIDPEAFFATLAQWTRVRHSVVSDVHAGATKSEEVIILPEIEGLDVATGLQRVAGNKRLYLDLLSQFVTKQRSACDQITAALERGDCHEAERLAHSLKGVAGNLGMDQILHLAGNLERAIREFPEGVEGLVKDLDSILDRQLLNIEEALKIAVPIIEKHGADVMVEPGAISEAIARLKVLLKANDLEASQAYFELGEILQAKVDPSQLNVLERAIKALDYEQALVTLDEITNSSEANQK
jgi:two-component system, sensor histidine kinase and response regulator